MDDNFRVDAVYIYHFSKAFDNYPYFLLLNEQTVVTKQFTIKKISYSRPIVSLMYNAVSNLKFLNYKATSTLNKRARRGLKKYGKALILVLKFDTELLNISTSIHLLLYV